MPDGLSGRQPRAERREDGPTDAADLPQALAAWARRPGSRVLLAEARRRAERRTLGHQGRLTVSLTASERRDVGILLGVHWEAGTTQPPIDGLRGRLRDHQVTLEQLLVATGGPIVDHVAHREQSRQARRAEEQAAEEALSAVLGPAMAAAVAARCLPVAGTGTRLRRAEQLATVARDRPDHAAAVPLAVLAARCLGDAHALDRTTALGRAAARMAALLGTRQAGARVDATGSAASNSPGRLGAVDTPGSPGWPAPQVGVGTAPVGDDALTAEAWRAAWSAVGVACDRVSSTVLVLNLPLTGSPALEALTSVPGEPVWLTARVLDAAAPPRPTTSAPVVFVCENPSIAESAADRLGPRSAPLVCTYGKPSLAALTLLRALDRGGSALRVRADNDPAGRAIVAAVLAVCPGAVRWRYDESTPPYEEQLVDDLIADLAG